MLDIYSDASGNFSLGFGAYCKNEWTWGQWNADFMKGKIPQHRIFRAIWPNSGSAEMDF